MIHCITIVYEQSLLLLVIGQQSNNGKVLTPIKMTRFIYEFISKITIQNIIASAFFVPFVPFQLNIKYLVL